MSTRVNDRAVDQDAPSAQTVIKDVDPDGDDAPAAVDETPGTIKDRQSGSRVAKTMVFGILPAIALLLSLGAGSLKWWEGAHRAVDIASAEPVKAATDSTIAMLSYQPATVDTELISARDRLTGAFRDSYTSLINDVVIPGATQKRISAVATVPAAAAVSVTEDHAVVLVMVNQTTVIGTDAPTQTATSIEVTLDKVDGRWLISDFTPI